MANTAELLELRRRLARWSDTHLEEACIFVQSFVSLIPDELSNVQLHGLANLARNIPTYKELEEFLLHQAMKAKRANRTKMQHCWEILKIKFNSFRNEAEIIANDLHQVQSTEEIHLRLIHFFVQHLIAESLIQANFKKTVQQPVSRDKTTKPHRKHLS